MIRKPKIGVDIDGVLSDSNVTYLEYVNNKHGLNFKPEDVTDYWYTDIAEIIGADEVKNCWKEVAKNDLLINAPLIHGARMFNLLPGDVGIVTHRHIESKDYTLIWLDYHNMYRHENNINFVQGPKSQTGVWDYFLEDCPDNVHDLLPFVNEKIILFNHPYNVNLDFDPNRVVRVDNWYDVIRFFKSETERGVI